MSPTRPLRVRRTRKVGEETVGIHAYVPPAIRQHANQAARDVGITLGRYIEILIARDADLVDEHGKPLWARVDIDLVDSIPLPSDLEEHAA